MILSGPPTIALLVFPCIRAKFDPFSTTATLTISRDPRIEFPEFTRKVSPRITQTHTE